MEAMRMNERMRLLLGDNGATLPALDPNLLALLRPGFLEIDGCVVLAVFEDSARRTSVASCHDETGYEAFINHVHVDDVLPASEPSLALGQARAFLTAIGERATAAYPPDEFQLIVSCSDSCVVRFHRVREGQTWLAADLESYDGEALLAVTARAR